MFYTLPTWILTIFVVTYVVAKESPCGEWTSFKDKKCYKILDDTLRTFEDAMISCTSLGNGSSLPVIHSEEEQSFLTEFIFETNSIPDNSWLGVKLIDKSYKWVDGSELTYTNWDPKRNKDINYEKQCVEMRAHSRFQGKWLDVSCAKRNVAVCEKPVLLEQPCANLEDVIQQLEEVKQTIKNITIIPIGFLYTQLPGEKPASEIWPSMNWTDVSENYAGLFFRVLGNQTAPFGEEQAENAPRLIQVKQSYRLPAKVDHNQLVELKPNEWTPRITISCVELCDKGVDYMQFFASGGEVRPRNKAVRIWKRKA